MERESKCITKTDIYIREKNEDTNYQKNILIHEGYMRYRGRGTSEYRGGPRGRGVYRLQGPTTGNTLDLEEGVCTDHSDQQLGTPWT